MKEKWMEDYNERETAGARKRVEDAEAAVQQEQQDMKNAENAALMNRVPKKSLQEMMVAVRENLSDSACSDDGEVGEDTDDEETEQHKLSEDGKPGWVMGADSKSVE